MTHQTFVRPDWPVRHEDMQHRGAAMPAIACLRALATWIGRRRQRLAIGELAERNDYLLQDIGVSRDDALAEATKPFWKR